VAAFTLNPPPDFGSLAQRDLSVFMASKAVGQLLYAQDWCAPC
jgi:hypothetical protein